MEIGTDSGLTKVSQHCDVQDKGSCPHLLLYVIVTHPSRVPLRTLCVLPPLSPIAS